MSDGMIAGFTASILAMAMLALIILIARDSGRAAMRDEITRYGCDVVVNASKQP